MPAIPVERARQWSVWRAQPDDTAAGMEKNRQGCIAAWKHGWILSALADSCYFGLL
jgi:hypothetical protein